ncbi:MAG: hypothetical protein, partial [Olavius algarvensis Gamma 3 endosymbiont]
GRSRPPRFHRNGARRQSQRAPGIPDQATGLRYLVFAKVCRFDNHPGGISRQSRNEGDRGSAGSLRTVPNL